jgi:hypothetical protein
MVTEAVATCVYIRSWSTNTTDCFDQPGNSRVIFYDKISCNLVE